MAQNAKGKCEQQLAEQPQPKCCTALGLTGYTLQIEATDHMQNILDAPAGWTWPGMTGRQFARGLPRLRSCGDDGGDWERKNRLKVYEAIFLMATPQLQGSCPSSSSTQWPPSPRTLLQNHLSCQAKKLALKDYIAQAWNIWIHKHGSTRRQGKKSKKQQDQTQKTMTNLIERDLSRRKQACKYELARLALKCIVANRRAVLRVLSWASCNTFYVSA